MDRCSLLFRLWFRGRFYLSGLVLILPMMAFPAYFKMAGTPPLGGHILPSRDVGPYHVTLAEFRPGPPRLGPRSVPLKDLVVEIEEGYPQLIRSAYLRLGQPPNDRNLGEPLHGNPYRLAVELPLIAQPKAGQAVWLTLEDWDGTLHQTSWPIEEVLTGMALEPPENGRHTAKTKS